jgi:phosphoribosyl 1,2-cyclic phosphodiesterase
MPKLNYFGVNASQSLAEWEKKGWIYHEDPRGWFRWYCRYYSGRRFQDDLRQIGRWRAVRRHVAQLEKHCAGRDLSCRRRQRFKLLECLPRLGVDGEPIMRAGDGIRSNSDASGANARSRGVGNPARSPTAVRRKSGLGGSKAMLRSGAQRMIVAIFHKSSVADRRRVDIESSSLSGRSVACLTGVAIVFQMKITFLGTRGEIEARTQRHKMHSSLLVSYRSADVMIDCGLDWLGKFERLHPDAIVLTHAHPDHAWGLRNGAPCPVFAPEQTWQNLTSCRVEDRHLINERTATKVCGITFEAFLVEHSILAPAVAYRITSGSARIFYGPDLLFIHDRASALKDVQLYIGDGATLTRSFVRKRGDRLIGHAPVRTQLGWCTKEGVPWAIITHCGSEIVAGDERKLQATIKAIAREKGIEAQIAHDRMELALR